MFGRPRDLVTSKLIRHLFWADTSTIMEGISFGGRPTRLSWEIWPAAQGDTALAHGEKGIIQLSKALHFLVLLA